uniref:Uncharacterized protein n=1 Tax=Steinernema glaseri TaxID=37863 RepID=A0A1I7ZI95_9BILA
MDNSSRKELCTLRRRRLMDPPIHLPDDPLTFNHKVITAGALLYTEMYPIRIRCLVHAYIISGPANS